MMNVIYPQQVYSRAAAVTGRPSMADMPSASMAHIAQAAGPPEPLQLAAGRRLPGQAEGG
jgi:hypothetical protein